MQIAFWKLIPCVKVDNNRKLLSWDTELYWMAAVAMGFLSNPGNLARGVGDNGRNHQNVASIERAVESYIHYTIENNSYRRILQ